MTPSDISDLSRAGDGNADERTVAGFGDEWTCFDQTELAADEHSELWRRSFERFPWAEIGPAAVGADIGCGSGRWAALVAPRVERFDDRPAWYRALWRLSDMVRRVIARLPFRACSLVAEAIAVGVYWPLARAAQLAERRGRRVDDFPLAFYRAQSLYTLRTDAPDRFGTSLEQRFLRSELVAMPQRVGFERISFNEQVPFWCALAYRSGATAP